MRFTPKTPTRATLIEVTKKAATLEGNGRSRICVGRKLLQLCAALATVLTVSSSFAVNDPTLRWRTIETKHFRITYYSGEKPLAEHIGDLAESIHTRLSQAVGWEPSELTEIILTDQTDAANGSAIAIPYNAIRLNVTAPDDISPLGDVDDWYLELLTHEYTHILHTDHKRGVPNILNALLGKTYAPNAVQPRWLLEGLAVFEESARTTGGRLRSSQWNMYMRADLLEGNVATLDQFSNTPRRWPQGTLWYLYGSFFTQWIASTYGEEAIRRMVDEYGWHIIPYGINRAIRRATGRTFEELYPGWIATQTAAARADAEAVRARGLREGKRLTFHGQMARSPRWIPTQAWSGAAGDILYFRDDAHSTPGFYRLPIYRNAAGGIDHAAPDRSELFIRTNVPATASFTPAGGVVFEARAITKLVFRFSDLFELSPRKTDPSGFGPSKRITHGFRATAPDVSPDGRRVVFITNHRGTSTLQVADLTPEANGGDRLAHIRALVESAPLEQAYTPRWGPDNRHVAYSVWTEGGYRDIRIVDTVDGTIRQVTLDRAIDGDPCFSPDGSWLFFHSDRTGVMNIYAFEIATGALKQVTNVINGAYQPAVSPDGKALVYIGYTSQGFDVFGLDLVADHWLEAPPANDTRPLAPPAPPATAQRDVPYNPLRTLIPRNYNPLGSVVFRGGRLDFTPGNFGQAVILSTTGSDIAGLHRVGATMRIEVNRPTVEGSIGYAYLQMPFDMGLRAFRTVVPGGAGPLGFGGRSYLIKETIGGESGLLFELPGTYNGHQVSLKYTAARVNRDFSSSPLPFDPYEIPVFASHQNLGTVHVGWSLSTTQSFLWGVAPEKGIALAAGMDLTQPWLASDFAGMAANVRGKGYIAMPWGHHHTLGIGAGAGVSRGRLPGVPFFVSGSVDAPALAADANLLVDGGVVLRGFPVLALAGPNYAIANVDYKFPIFNIDRGPSTLPFFINRLNGTLFADSGSVFRTVTNARLRTGVGGELWLECQYGYQLKVTLRVGYAQGVSPGGLSNVYFVSGIPF